MGWYWEYRAYLFYCPGKGGKRYGFMIFLSSLPVRCQDCTIKMSELGAD